ncbi:MAG: tyrosine-type recombinase/integrase [Rhodoferax sp.]|nr:tyrosine-type recombinase/integrase [Rhodoferax sp.]
MLLDLLWGLRGDECRSVKWRDQISEAEAERDRWIDMKERVVRINDAKNRSDHEFPIGPCAYELLKLRRESQLEGEVWVFPAMSPNSLKGYYSDPTVAMQTVRDKAGIKVVRGHDLRRTFGAACEKLGLTDRQIKRMLGHGVAGGETLGRYTTPEWEDIADRMKKVEEEILEGGTSGLQRVEASQCCAFAGCGGGRDRSQAQGEDIPAQATIIAAWNKGRKARRDVS